MNGLAAAALAAGELICEFKEEVLVYEAMRSGSAEVLSMRYPGRRAVQVRAGAAAAWRAITNPAAVSRRYMPGTSTR